MTLLTILLILYCGSNQLVSVATHPLYIFGMWKLFAKCGEKSWKSFIPLYDVYSVSRMASCEPEGRLTFIAGIFLRLFLVVWVLIPDVSETGDLMASVLVLICYMIDIVYRIRVFNGLCDMFGRSRKWALAWMLSSTVMSLIWGLNDKYKPLWMAQDVEGKIDTFFSGSDAAVMENGLTVNIKERVAREFMTKKYLLRDIHMNIAPGHMVLLLGGSGAGKTTLLNAINGYEKANAEIFLNGGNIYNDYKHMQYEIGFVPQLDLMRGKDTVLHTLRDAAQLRLPQEFSTQDRNKRVDEVMTIFGLNPVKNNLVDKLSGGQRKRLSIAMEFISNPSLFILDEPDSGLDGVMARELMEQLRRIANQGKIVIVITHTPDRVIDLFDDVIVLAKDANRTGRLAYYGPITEAREFFDRPNMERIVMSINRKEEGGDGLADEFIKKYVEVQNAKA